MTHDQDLLDQLRKRLLNQAHHDGQFTRQTAEAYLTTRTQLVLDGRHPAWTDSDAYAVRALLTALADLPASDQARYPAPRTCRGQT